ncbi:MAG TPA: DNA-3-methyladenine glycosylase [Candidatus Margulisbacteria bacterium]|nr:MAG: hypothetical protein A2X41_00730 [Candidatus Margulisbacteria bacterium GWE2_39_32]HCY35725.1 DNA-3-methyladenine glycosylase [Candidatus Margulisiibacteriota bacterium]
MLNIPRSFYLNDTLSVAKALLGKILVRYLNGKRLAGIIVETEAYLENEESCHAYRGITARTKTMFEEGGIAYVYLIYGMYYCLNIVTESQGKGCAVLIRAVEPVDGIEIMQQLRKKTGLHDLASGPGKLAQAFNITKLDNGLDIAAGTALTIENHNDKDPEIMTTPRIGIKKAKDLPYRFFIHGNQFVSQG